MEGKQLSLRTYRAYTMAEALTAVKSDLGSGATILHTRTYKRGGILGLGRKTVVEVTASLDTARPGARKRDTASADNVSRAGGDGGPMRAAARAYAGSMNGSAATRATHGAPRAEQHNLMPADPLAEKKLDLLAAIDEHRRSSRTGSEPSGAGAAASKHVPAPDHIREIEIKPAPRPISDQQAATETVQTTHTAEAEPEKSPPREPIGSVAKRFILHDPERTTDPPTAATPSNRKNVVIPAAGDPPRHGNPGAKELQALEQKLLSAVEKSNRESAAVHDEMHVIRDMVRQVLDRQQGSSALSMSAAAYRDRRYEPGPLPALVYDVYERLVEQDLEDDVVRSIVEGVQRELSSEALHDAEEVRAAARTRIAELFSVADAPFVIPPRNDRPLIIALIGPTGVGKTTTLAKLAATFKLRHGKRVGLVTSDTYRIAAVEQLRTYADIIGLPLKVALTPAEMVQACHRLRDCDVIMIDTAGRSQNDEEKLSQLSEFMNAADLLIDGGYIAFKGGKANVSPSFSGSSSVEKPGPSVAISNRMPFETGK